MISSWDISQAFLMGGRKCGEVMAWLITRHTFLSLGWDEWGSIAAFVTAMVIAIRWLTKKVQHDLLDETIQQLRLLNHNMEIKNQHDEKVDERLEKGHDKFIRHESQLNDHERRITRLEDERNDNKHH